MQSEYHASASDALKVAVFVRVTKAVLKHTDAHARSRGCEEYLYWWMKTPIALRVSFSLHFKKKHKHGPEEDPRYLSTILLQRLSPSFLKLAYP